MLSSDHIEYAKFIYGTLSLAKLEYYISMNSEMRTNHSRGLKEVFLSTFRERYSREQALANSPEKITLYTIFYALVKNLWKSGLLYLPLVKPALYHSSAPTVM